MPRRKSGPRGPLFCWARLSDTPVTDPSDRPILDRQHDLAEAIVAILEGKPAIRAEVVSDLTVMSGEPVVRGTRVPAETVVAYLRAGHSAQDIFTDYPSLPVDGIDAVVRWADGVYGAGWQTAVPPVASR